MWGIHTFRPQHQVTREGSSEMFKPNSSMSRAFVGTDLGNPIQSNKFTHTGKMYWLA